MAKLFKTAFAYQGAKEQLPDSAQPDGKASFAEGFTDEYTLDYGDADARDIAQSELNGIFHDITEAIGELQKYGVAVWQSDMTPIAKYSLVFHGDKLWQAKKNTSATPAAGADWQQVDIADIVSQLGTLDLTNYATKTYVDNSVIGLASTSYVDSAVAPKATASVVNAQLAGKFDKTDVVQESGQSTTKVMSQKAVTDAIGDAAAGQLSWGGITGDIENQADLQNALALKLDKTDASEYTKRSADETITGDWDFQGEMKVGNYTYNTIFGSFPVEKIITYNHPILSSPMSIAYGIDKTYTFSSMEVAYNVNDLGLGEFIAISLLAEEQSITGGNTNVQSVTGKDIDGIVEKRVDIEARANGGVSTSIDVVSRSDGVSYIDFGTGTEPVRGLYANNILTGSGGITIKAALDSKADKVQEKVILETSRALTQADMYKVLLVSADGITITLPAGIPNFTVDIVKMDEDFITLAQTSSTDKFREDVSAITIIKDVTIFSSGVAGKEYVAIGAYEV